MINRICADRKIPRVIFLRQIIEDHLRDSPKDFREVKEKLDDIKKQIAKIRLRPGYHDEIEVKGLTNRTKIMKKEPIRAQLMNELKNVFGGMKSD